MITHSHPVDELHIKIIWSIENVSVNLVKNRVHCRALIRAAAVVDHVANMGMINMSGKN